MNVFIRKNDTIKYVTGGGYSLGIDGSFSPPVNFKVITGRNKEFMTQPAFLFIDQDYIHYK